MAFPQFKPAELPLDEALAIWALTEHMHYAKRAEHRIATARAKAQSVIFKHGNAAIDRLCPAEPSSMSALEKAARDVDRAISQWFAWGCFVHDGRAAPLAYEVQDALRAALAKASDPAA